MKKKLLSILLLTAIAFNYAKAAYFSIVNKSNRLIKVCPLWDGRPEVYEILRPGDSKSFNSYLHNVEGIRWLEKVDLGTNYPTNYFCFKSFEQKVSLGRLNIFGSFHIMNDGSFDYHFGVDGSQEGVASNFIIE